MLNFRSANLIFALLATSYQPPAALWRRACITRLVQPNQSPIVVEASFGCFPLKIVSVSWADEYGVILLEGQAHELCAGA
jgi:hypothetical protein